MSCFKAYDIRGVVPDQFNADLAWRIGLAFALELRPGQVVVGRDARLSSPALASALTEGLLCGGADVMDIGLCGTEEIYHATFSQSFGGGIMVTGSHNPANHNGLKLIRTGAVPISGDSGLFAIRDKALSGDLPTAKHKGTRRKGSFRAEYIEHLLRHIDEKALSPLKIVANAGNGCAGLVCAPLSGRLPFAITLLNAEPDGAFPNGVPNPLLPERRQETSQAVRDAGADLGIAWDGDFDRCFFFDERGEFIEGYYVVGLLAQSILRQFPGEKIIHDPRLTWNTEELVEGAGGVAVQSKTGHAFIKERMRAENAVYGGEMSAHHYFRDFAYCDSGMIPWLLVAGLMSSTGRPLSELVGERRRAFPCSGEINRKVSDSAGAISAVREHFRNSGGREDHTDGLSLEFDYWRFNLRSSNTESLLRLNVEARGDSALMQRKTDEILTLIDHFSL